LFMIVELRIIEVVPQKADSLVPVIKDVTRNFLPLSTN